jgi:hypothetical protein
MATAATRRYRFIDLESDEVIVGVRRSGYVPVEARQMQTVPVEYRYIDKGIVCSRVVQLFRHSHILRIIRICNSKREQDTLPCSRLLLQNLTMIWLQIDAMVLSCAA